MKYSGIINEIAINTSNGSPIVTATFTDNVAGKKYINQAVSYPFGFISIPNIGNTCSYSSVGSPYNSTGIDGVYITAEDCPNLFEGTPVELGESAIWNSYGITLKALQSGLLSTFTGSEGVTETKIAIDYNVIKAIIDILGFLVNQFPNHTHTNGNAGNPTGTVIQSLPSDITTDQTFFGTDVNDAPTYINLAGKLIGS